MTDKKLTEQAHPHACCCRMCAVEAWVDARQKDEAARVEDEAKRILAAGGKPVIIIRGFGSPDQVMGVVEEKDAPSWAPHIVEDGEEP